MRRPRSRDWENDGCVTVASFRQVFRIFEHAIDA
jgi:hypothetical protein